MVFTGVLPSAAQLSGQAQMSLITVYPGEAIHSLWGHSALRVYDPVQGFDIAYNYGTFDFGNPIVFMGRFAYGKLDYTLSRQYYPSLIDRAHQQGRGVIEQSLQLDSTQRAILFRFLEQNMLPENRTYRYDFLFDNCATRIRDLFTEVLGIPLPASAASDFTYRDLVRPYSAHLSLLNLGIHLGMGLPADRNTVDRSFLPLELMDVVSEMHTDSSMLVARTDTLSRSSPSNRQPWPWTTVLAWLGVALGITVIFKGPARTFDRVYYGLMGVAGIVVAFLWFVSLHNVTQPNLNLLWLWPTHLIVSFQKRDVRWSRWYYLATFAATTGFLVALPFLSQAVPSAAVPWAILGALRSGYRTSNYFGYKIFEIIKL